MTADLPDTVRAAAQAAGRAIGGAHRRLGRWADPREEHVVSLLMCVGAPAVTYSTWSTVSLHLHENRLDAQDVRTELLGVSDVAAFPDALATAAFYVMKDRWLVAPGVVFPGILLDYDLGTTMEHVMWAPPFPWPSLNAVQLSPGLDAHWLLAIPIYESERRFLMDRGYFEFEDLLEAHDTQYFDPGRAAVV